MLSRLALLGAAILLTSFQASPMHDNHLDAALRSLPEIIQSFATTEVEVNIDEEKKTLIEIMQSKETEIVDLYKSHSLGAEIGWGPFSAGLTDTQVVQEFRKLQREFSSERNQEEIRKAFLSRTKTRLDPAVGPAIDGYFRYLTEIERLAAESRKFFTFRMLHNEDKAMSFVITWPEMPSVVSGLRGIEIVRIAVNGTELPHAGGAAPLVVTSPYSFTVPRSDKGVALVDIAFRAEGFGQYQYTPETVRVEAYGVLPCGACKATQDELATVKTELATAQAMLDDQGKIWADWAIRFEIAELSVQAQQHMMDWAAESLYAGLNRQWEKDTFESRAKENKLGIVTSEEKLFDALNAYRRLDNSTLATKQPYAEKYEMYQSKRGDLDSLRWVMRKSAEYVRDIATMLDKRSD